MSQLKVLVIEDDRSLSEVLVYNLTQSGYLVDSAFDGQTGLEKSRLHLPDIILLDVMIPVIDGIEVCQRIRAIQELRETLIIMLTAKSDESDQLVGFSAGADDYVTKPFSVKILLERLKAHRRNRERLATNNIETVNRCGITIDRLKHQTMLNGKIVDLTPSEFRLLNTLIRQPGRTFARSELIDAALGADTYVLERTIDVHVRALRKKLGEHADNIETVRGIGYRFRESTDHLGD